MAFRSSSGLTGGNGNSAAIPVPSGATSGDIAVIGIYKENTANITGVPSGFTLKAQLDTTAGSRGSLWVYWKRLTAADTGTYSFSWSGSTWRSGVCALFSGRVSSGDPFDGTVGTAQSTTTVSTLAVSTSPTASDGDAAGLWTNFQGGNAYTPPSGYTERQDLDVITIDTQDAVASGSTGSISATSNVSGFQKAFLGVLAVASSGVTGTATPTEASDTSTASGQLGYSGTSAATETADTSSASGAVVNPVTGTSAATQANQTSSASGQLGYSGTVARTQANQTSSASGQLGYSGTSARTQDNQTSTASGNFTAGGSFSGTAAVTQAAQTASASGTFTPGATSGSAAVTQASQTSAASGKLGYSGTVARSQASQTSTASGLVANPVTGTVAVNQAANTASAVGLIGGTEFSAESSPVVMARRRGAAMVLEHSGDVAAVIAIRTGGPAASGRTDSASSIT